MAKCSRLPLKDCLVNANWRESLLATVVISRKRSDGQLAVGVFLVDLGCLGVKNAIAHNSMSRGDYSRVLQRTNDSVEQLLEPCEPALAVKIVETAVAYARELGFEAEPDYYAARWIYHGLSGESAEPVVCGKDGKPFYVGGPHDNVSDIMDHLTERLGAEGFHYFFPMGQ